MADAAAPTHEDGFDEGCLHCRLSETIAVFYQENGGGTGDLNEVIVHVVTLLSGLITMVPLADRDVYLNDVSREMRSMVESRTYGTEASQ